MDGRKTTRGAALVAATLGIFTLGTLGLIMASLVSTRVTTAIERLQSTQAFYVAEGGIQSILMSQFNGDTDFSDNVSPTDPPFGANAISLTPGQFWVEYLTQAPGSADIRVTARVGQAVRQVRLSVGQGGGGVQYVTMGDGNLAITDSSGAIYGDLVLDGNYTIDPDVTMNGNITQDNSLEIPPIDFNTYLDMTDSTHYGSLAISSDYTGDLHVTGSVVFYGNVTYNGLLYADGSIAFSGGTTTVNGTIVSEGNVAVQAGGSFQVTSQPAPGGGQMPAMLTGGNLSIDGTTDVDITGAVWTDGNVHVTGVGDFDLTGTFLTTGNTEIDNVASLSVTFDADLVAQIPGLSGEGGNQGLTLANWQTY